METLTQPVLIDQRIAHLIQADAWMKVLDLTVEEARPLYFALSSLAASARQARREDTDTLTAKRSVQINYEKVKGLVAEHKNKNVRTLEENKEFAEAIKLGVRG